MRRLLLAILLICAVSLPCMAAGYDDDDDEINIPKLKDAAERGDPEAQYRLGNAYQMGEGVLQDDVKAVFWITKAANQNYPEAQFNLGMVYRGGFGVQQDYVTAYMWLELGVANGNEKAFALRSELAPYLSMSQIREARYRAQNWKPKKDDEDE